jgi:hypothetical protein
MQPAQTIFSREHPQLLVSLFICNFFLFGQGESLPHYTAYCPLPDGSGGSGRPRADGLHRSKHSKNVVACSWRYLTGGAKLIRKAPQSQPLRARKPILRLWANSFRGIILLLVGAYCFFRLIGMARYHIDPDRTFRQNRNGGSAGSLIRAIKGAHHEATQEPAPATRSPRWPPRRQHLILLIAAASGDTTMTLAELRAEVCGEAIKAGGVAAAIKAREIILR